MNGWRYSGNFFIGYQLPFYPVIPGAFIQVEQTFYHGEAGYEAGFKNFRDWVIDDGNPVRVKFSAAKVILMLRF
jgi:hypothetical protein